MVPPLSKGLYMMTRSDLLYLPFENGLQEYKSRKVDWNVSVHVFD
jgi:hypothetical protein